VVCCYKRWGKFHRDVLFQRARYSLPQPTPFAFWRVRIPRAELIFAKLATSTNSIKHRAAVDRLSWVITTFFFFPFFLHPPCLKDHCCYFQQREQEEEHYLLPGGVFTTAEPRPNAYIPDDDSELPIPRPYGSLAPFKPTEPGSTMRHIRKPVIKPIEI